jgi:FkbH-like protein
MNPLHYLNVANQSEHAQTGTVSKIRIHLITNFTDGILKKIFLGYCLDQGVTPEIICTAYRQYSFALKDSTNPIYDLATVSFILFDVNAYRESEFYSSEYFYQVLDDIRHYAQQQRGPIVVSTFPVPYQNSHQLLFYEHSLYKKIIEYNKAIHQMANELSSVYVYDINKKLAQMGEMHSRDWRGLYAYDIPFTNDFFLSLVKEWYGYVTIFIGRGRKCLVVDLDNTLWGGVVGELGPTGIALGPEYPGIAFQNFQRNLLDLHDRGIILAINSKNNEADVAEVFEKNPYMILRKEHFACIKTNWENKAHNLLEISEELNIGTDSMVFLDDDLVNQELIRREFPEVMVLPFATEPEHYTELLFSSTAFPQLRITAEDLQKNELYAVEDRRQVFKKTVGNLDEYIRELGIEITMHYNDRLLIERSSQLTQKTNQFNLTTKRYSEKDIEHLMRSGVVIVGDVQDKFGVYGITTLAIFIPGLDKKTIVLDTFLMSCRVMGRGVENVFLAAILSELYKQGIRTMKAQFLPTAKNIPAKNFLKQFGCREDKTDVSSSLYVHQLVEKKEDSIFLIKESSPFPTIKFNNL